MEDDNLATPAAFDGSIKEIALTPEEFDDAVQKLCTMGLVEKTEGGFIVKSQAYQLIHDYFSGCLESVPAPPGAQDDINNKGDLT